MLTLYTRAGCPFCAKVLSVLHARAIPFEEKDITDSAIAEELIARGGKRQAPYLVDDERGVEMYESDAIVAYLLGHK